MQHFFFVLKPAVMAYFSSILGQIWFYITSEHDGICLIRTHMKCLIFVFVFFTGEIATVVSIEATPLINHKNRLFQLW